MKKTVFLLILSFSFLLLVSCGPDVETTSPTLTTPTASVTLSQTGTTSTPSETTASISETTETTATTQSEAEIAAGILESAARRVIITGADALESDFLLPASVGEVTVSWTSDHPEYVTVANQSHLSTEGYDLFTVSVNRPSEADVTVILTGHFVFGIYSLDAEFVLRVKLESGLTVYPTISALQAGAVLTDYVQTTGYVYSLYKYGYFLIDASGVPLGIYTTEENAAAVSVGDEVVVKGTYAQYHSLFQLTNLTKQTILSSDNAVDVTPTVLDDPTALLTQNYSLKALQGQIFQVKATLKQEVSGSYTNLYLYSGTTRIALVYYNSDANSLAALTTHLDTEITLNVLYYTYYESLSLPYVTFYGTDSDIVPSPLTDEQKLSRDVAALALPANAVAGDALALPQTGTNGSAITWVSENPSLAPIGNGNVLFDVSIAFERITLTATVTYGSLSPVEKSFEIVVFGEMNLAALGQLGAGTATTAMGQVYLVLQNGYFIQDESGTLAVFTNTAPTVVPGDTVVVSGTLSVYGTLKQLGTITSTEILSSGVRSIPASLAYSETASLTTGALYRISATVKKEGSYNNYYLYDGETKIGVIYYKSPADALANLETLVGSTVTLEAYFYTMNADSNAGGLLSAFFAYDNFASSLTDEQKALRDLSEVSVDSEGFLDRIVYYPQEGYYGSTLSYASNHPEAAVFGSVAGITFGVSAHYTACVPITVTVTATCGTAIATRDFPVNVGILTVTSVGDVGEPLEGVEVYVEGTVVAFQGASGFFLQDSLTGDGLYVDGWISGLTLGNRVVIRGTVTLMANAEGNSFALGGSLKLVWNDHENTPVTYTILDGTGLPDPDTVSWVGKYLSVTNLPVAKYESGYVWFLLGNSGDTDIYLKVAYGDPLLPVAFPAGTVLTTLKTIVFRPFGTDFEGLALSLPAMTDAQKLAVDSFRVEDSVTVTTEFTLSEPLYGTYSDITVSAGLASVLSWESGVFTVTRPGAGSPDAVGDVSFTLTVGSASTSLSIHVIVEAPATAGFADLFISEYVEGSSNNKYLEIFNGTGAAIDLSAYTLELYSNGATTVSATMTLSGILNSGCVVVIANGSAALSYSNPDGINLISSTVINFNGDDVVILKHNGAVIDVIGTLGTRPAVGYWGTTSLGTKDCTLVRNPSVTGGRTDPSADFDPSLEWTGYPKDTAAYLGDHTTD